MLLPSLLSFPLFSSSRPSSQTDPEYLDARTSPFSLSLPPPITCSPLALAFACAHLPAPPRRNKPTTEMPNEHSENASLNTSPPSNHESPHLKREKISVMSLFKSSHEKSSKRTIPSEMRLFVFVHLYVLKMPRLREGMRRSQQWRRLLGLYLRLWLRLRLRYRLKV